MRKNHAFLFVAFIMLFALSFVMFAMIGFQSTGFILDLFPGIIVIGFGYMINNLKYYIPTAISILSINTGLFLAFLPMLCAFAFLIVTFFKHKFIIGAYASVVIAFLILGTAFTISVLATNTVYILNNGTYLVQSFKNAFNGSFDFGTIYPIVMLTLSMVSMTLMRFSLLFIPFVIFLLLCLSLITVMAKDPYAKTRGAKKWEKIILSYSPLS